MRILAEEVYNLGFDTEQFRYVLIAVQAFCDKKWNDDHIWRIGELVPLRDQWRFFHVRVPDGGEFPTRTNQFRFTFGRDRAIVIQFRSMRDDQQRSLSGFDVRRDFMGA